MRTDYRTYEMSPAENRRFILCGFLIIAGALYLFYHSLLLSALCGTVIFRFIPWQRQHLAKKRKELLRRQFLDLLTSLSASIGAGRQMEDALLEAWDNLALLYPEDAPIMQELAYMKHGMRESRDTDRQLLADFAARSDTEDVRSFVRVYLVCRNTGGDLQKVIGHASGIISEKMKINEEIQTFMAQQKLEGRLICLSPPGMLLAMNLLSPSYIAVLYSCLAGRLIMTFCLGLTISGLILMEKITDVYI